MFYSSVATGVTIALLQVLLQVLLTCCDLELFAEMGQDAIDHTPVHVIEEVAHLACRSS